MSANLSTAKANALLTRVQLNPEIGTADPLYVADLVTRAANDFVSTTHLPRYPELSAGYAQSGASPSTDLTALSTNRFRIAVNTANFVDVTITLANCTTGLLTAAELQTQIRAVGVVGGFDEVTVAYASSLYTITSGRYGERSRVCVGFNESTKHVCLALKLSEDYGGVEYSGSAARAEADDLVVEMVEILYRKLGLEGTQSGSAPGDNSYQMFAEELSPSACRKLSGFKRLW